MQAELGHRRVILPPGATELETASGSSAGSATSSSSWSTEAAESPPTPRTSRRSRPERLRPLRREIIREWQRDADDKTVSEILAADMLRWRAANSRVFGIVEDGEVVSSAQLFSDGGTAQVEEVPRCRRTGAAATPRPRHAGGRGGPRRRPRVHLPRRRRRRLAEGALPRLGFEEVGSRFAFLKRSRPERSLSSALPIDCFPCRTGSKRSPCFSMRARARRPS